MNNSVFISYRRNVSSYIARAVFQDLRANGIDAFMDVENINSGQFDTIILNQIAARPYFLIILTPGTLDRCKEPGDWLLREMNHAIKLKRIIIPLVTPGFNFDDAQKFLKKSLAAKLSRFNAVNVPHDYFEAAMERLRTRFLKPIDLLVTPTPKSDETAVLQRIAQVTAEPIVTANQLSIPDHNEVIRLDPQFFIAYYNQGFVYAASGDTSTAITDYSEMIRQKPQDANAYLNRGLARKAKGDLDGAIADYTKSIELKNPDLHVPYNNRGNALKAKGDWDGAIADYSEAIRLDPQFSIAYYNRALVHAEKGNYKDAVSDGERFLELQPDFSSELIVRYKIARWRKFID